MKLYNIPHSGNSYRVRLMLGLLGLEAELVDLDSKAGDTHRPDFLKINRLGEAPALVDGAVTLRDSSAILVYLAKRYGNGAWLPEDAAGAGAVQQWLSVATNEIHNGPRFARAIAMGMVPGDLAHHQAQTRRLFAFMNGELEGRRWLAAPQATIADVACYPYVWNAHQGGIDMEAYRAMREWLGRVEALPGFVAM